MIDHGTFSFPYHLSVTLELCNMSYDCYCILLAVTSAVDVLVMCVDVSQCWPELLRGLKYFGRTAARVIRLSAALRMVFSGRCANITSIKSKPNSQARLMQVQMFSSNVP